MVTVVVVMRVVVRIGVLVKAFFAVKNQEVKTERVKSSHKNTGQDSKISKAGTRKITQVHRFNNAVFGVKACKQRCTNQCQRPKQRSDPGDGHVFAKPTHPANILIMVNPHDDRTGRKE